MSSGGYYHEGEGPRRPPSRSFKVAVAEPEKDPFDTPPKSSMIDSAPKIEKRCDDRYNRGGLVTGSIKKTENPSATP